MISVLFLALLSVNTFLDFVKYVFVFCVFAIKYMLDRLFNIGQ